MITRTGDFAQNNRITQLFLDAQTRLRDVQAQLSSGKVTDQFRDLAPDVNRLLDAKNLLQKARQYQTNNRLVDGRLQVMESATGSLFELGTRLRTLLIQRLNDGTSVPGTMTADATLMLDQVVAELNAELDGQFLFAGSKTDTAPVQLDPAFTNFGSPDDTYYQGDDVELAVLADDDLLLTYGMTADREGFQELIGALRTVIEADVIDDRPLLESALDLVDSALPKLADYRSELGARQARLADINIRHGDMEVYLQRQISDVEDVDIAAAVTRLSQDQVLIESAMATIGRLSRLSLADYLR